MGNIKKKRFGGRRGREVRMHKQEEEMRMEEYKKRKKVGRE
jgi:hypothetical protein